jgi:hypothetical protein
MLTSTTTKCRRSSRCARPAGSLTIETFDAFDLPDWLGTEQVTWRADGILAESPRVPGSLNAGRCSHPLDLLAVDAAYPRSLCTSQQRHDAHQAWHFGEVLLLADSGRVAAAVPTVSFDANLAVDTIQRVAKALGAPHSNFTVLLTL